MSRDVGGRRWERAAQTGWGTVGRSSPEGVTENFLG